MKWLINHWIYTPLRKLFIRCIINAFPYLTTASSAPGLLRVQVPKSFNSYEESNPYAHSKHIHSIYAPLRLPVSTPINPWFQSSPPPLLAPGDLRSEKADWLFGSVSHSLDTLQAGWIVASVRHIGFDLQQHAVRIGDAQFDQLPCRRFILDRRNHAPVEGMRSGSRSTLRQGGESNPALTLSVSWPHRWSVHGLIGGRSRWTQSSTWSRYAG